jgi:hypothetical protein
MKFFLSNWLHQALPIHIIDIGANLLKMAIFLHDVYGSYDLALRALICYDDICSTQYAAQYIQNFLSTSKN